MVRGVGLLALGGVQGFVGFRLLSVSQLTMSSEIGWWMVRSGLGEERRDEMREIRVKPFRLMVHLGLYDMVDHLSHNLPSYLNRIGSFNFISSH